MRSETASGVSNVAVMLRGKSAGIVMVLPSALYVAPATSPFHTTDCEASAGVAVKLAVPPLAAITVVLSSVPAPSTAAESV